MPKQTKAELQEAQTRLVLASIEDSGTVPWKQPWTMTGFGANYNYSTGIAYRGVNVLMTAVSALEHGFTSPAWLTYKQAKALDGQVRQGSTGTAITVWKPWKAKDKATGEDVVKYMAPRTYHIFNLDQIDGIEYEAPDLGEPVEVTDAIEQIKRAYVGRPTIEHRCQDKACYMPGIDKIMLPVLEQFDSTEGYAETLFHELVHSTGHKSRLNREGVGCRGSYAREELVAELGAAMLMAEAGIQANIAAMADYVDHWHAALSRDPALIMSAAQAAQKAVDHINPAVETAAA